MRLRTLSLIITVLFALLLLAAFYVQVIKAPLYTELAQNNSIRIVPITAPRGDIYDRNSRLLVTSRTSFDCIVIPQEISEKERLFSSLSRIFNISKATLKRRFKGRYISPFTPIVIVEDIAKDKAIEIEEERLILRGVFIRTRPVRNYIYKDACAHLTGYIGEIGRRELDRLDRYGYRMSDLIGKSGIEKEYDNYLRGKDGGRQIEVDNMGRQVRVLGSRSAGKGKDIYLTIDIRLQEYVDEIFETKKGACIVMDAHNGDILSLHSKPAFDPNLFAATDKRIKNILRDSAYPLLNRAISCTYPPGSVFKIVTASAALRERKLDTGRRFVCSGRHKVGGRVFRCWKEEGHGSQNITDAIKNSCNIFFYNAGVLAGPDNIAKCAHKFGFGSPTGIDLPEEASGLVPSKLWKKLKTGKKWYDGETANYAIGQGYLLVTPLQILRMTAAIANKGFLVNPHVVKKIEDVEVSEEARRNLGISDKTINIVKAGLKKVVMDDSGTGINARPKKGSAAGKTGTAQTGRQKTHAWFTGFSPADEPKIALVVFLEEGGKGGLSASRLAGKIFDKARELDLL